MCNNALRERYINSEIAKFNTEELHNYRESQKDFWDLYAVTETAERKGREEGMAEGMAKGRAEGIEEGMAKGIEATNIATIKRIRAKGFDDEEIAELLNLECEYVKNCH